MRLLAREPPLLSTTRVCRANVGASGARRVSNQDGDSRTIVRTAPLSSIRRCHETALVTRGAVPAQARADTLQVAMPNVGMYFRVVHASMWRDAFLQAKLT